MTNGPTFEAAPGWGGKVTTWFTRNLLYIVPAAIVIVLIIVVVNTSGSDSEPISDQASSTPQETSQSGDLTVTIQARDNYTFIARRMISNALLVEQTGQITKGNRLYAETVLADKLKAQSLQVGAEISMPISTIWETLNAYADLYPAQRTKWETMAKNITF